MTDRGSALITVLCLSAALAALALAAVALARSSWTASTRRLSDVRALIGARSQAVEALAAGFSSDNQVATVSCRFQSGRDERLAVIEWRRRGGAWFVARWRETSP